MERRLLRHILDAFEQGLVAMPANFDAAIEIGFRPRHLEDALGFECGLGTKNVRVGLEAHARATPVRRAASFLQFAFRLAALERHSIELLLARDLDFHSLGQCIGD